MKPIIVLILLVSGQVSFGQKNQITYQTSSGLFMFEGRSATRTTAIEIMDYGDTDFIVNPYGKNSSLSYGFGVQFERLTSKNFIYGLQLSYESLSSKVTINKSNGQLGLYNIQEGAAILTNNFINLFPSFERRVKLCKGIDSDFLIGTDLGIGLSSTVNYSLPSRPEHEFLNTYELRRLHAIDFRPRIEFINYYKSFGLSIGYSYGLTNYIRPFFRGDRQVYARYLRCGLNYRL